jgi:hypothetical protein
LKDTLAGYGTLRNGRRDALEVYGRNVRVEKRSREHHPTQLPKTFSHTMMPLPFIHAACSSPLWSWFPPEELSHEGVGARSHRKWRGTQLG